MRVFTTEYGMYFDDFLLPFQCIQVMDGCDQVLFRRQFIGRMAPIAVGKDAELPTGYEFLQAFLGISEIAFRVLSPRR